MTKIELESKVIIVTNRTFADDVDMATFIIAVEEALNREYTQPSIRFHFDGSSVKKVT